VKNKPPVLLSLLTGIVLCVFATISSGAEFRITGLVEVVDGDSLKVQGFGIRLEGLDAPEREQECEAAGVLWPCGQEAREVLQQWTLNRQISCIGNTSDRSGRLLAECFVGKVSLNEQLVLHGLALAYREFSTEYVWEETRAREAERGIWQGRFIAPWDWRKGERLVTEVDEAQRLQDEQDAVSAFGAVAWAIQEQVRSNWNPRGGDFNGMSVSFTIRVDRDGNVTSVEMSRSSGNGRLDESAENAIFKASPLPIPTEARFYEYIKEFEFVFSPES